MPLRIYNPPLVVIGHGTRDVEGMREFQAFVGLVSASHPGGVEAGFLEFQRPSIQEAVDRAMMRIMACSESGNSDGIVVLPAQLLGARHVQVDIPREVDEARRRYPHIPIYLGPPLGLQDKIRAICYARCEEAVDPANRRETALLVVGRGTSDPKNTIIPRLADLLRDDLQCGLAIGCYAGIASPRLPEAFERAKEQSFRKILVFPFFLFMGSLVKTVHEETRRFSQAHPDCRVRVARYIGPDPLLRDALLDCYAEAIRNLQPQ